MISWDDAQLITQRLAQDSSANGIIFQNLMLNVGYKQVLAALGRQITEQQSTATLVPTQRNYQVPIDCNMPKTVVLISGTNRYPLKEEPSDLYFEARRSSQQTGQPDTFHFRPRFGVGGGVMELDPIPGTAYSLELTYEATEKDLSKAKYTTGTIALSAGSATLNGSTTTFTPDMIGRYVRPLADGAQRLPYRIKQFSSTTVLVLENVYQGSGQSNMAYEIVELFGLPEDIHMLPVYYALWQWWGSKGNAAKSASFEAQFDTGMVAAKERHSMTVRDNTIDYGSDGGGGIFGAPYPWFWPTAIAS